MPVKRIRAAIAEYLANIKPEYRCAEYNRFGHRCKNQATINGICWQHYRWQNKPPSRLRIPPTRPGKLD